MDFDYVGSEACTGCHAAQARAWAGSHHDLAMQPATAATVLGDFSGTQFVHHGSTTHFFTRDGRFFINTSGADGEAADFEVSFTFGVEPLQQYLVRVPNGALQAFSVAWDTRPAGAGGQRWFHVYGDEPISADDPLHWTASSQTWNHQCADCHSLNVRKHYDAQRRSYATTWSVIDVGCEGCHGPGGEHVRLAAAGGVSRPETSPLLGLTHQLQRYRPEHWARDAGQRVASRVGQVDNGSEINACARCHSRRMQLRERPFTGQPFLDDYVPARITPPAYHADGQINEEVYVYGSFLQSRMFQAGVTCSDCHDAHGGSVRATDNSLCTRCHAPPVYDAVDHHGHPGASIGAQCIECHMPAQNYIVIDARRDHSMRVPRPDLSVAHGTPNACNSCHADETSQWASEAVIRWRNGTVAAMPHHGDRLIPVHTASRMQAARSAVELLRDTTAPAIVRSSAVAALAADASRESLDALNSAASNRHALIRVAALDAAAATPLSLRRQLGISGLQDELLTVRITAAQALAAVPDHELPPEHLEARSRAEAEYQAAQRLNADRPEALINLGNYFFERQRFDAAQGAYDEALAIAPANVPATIGLAELARVAGDEEEVIAILARATDIMPASADLQHALGLAHVRQQNRRSALRYLARAAELAPRNQRYQYVLAVARQSYGDPVAALEGLEPVAGSFADDADITLLLSELHLETGDLDGAIRYAQRLAALRPEDVRVRA
ncbi:MAG: hypothetical protein HKO62_02465, partial [Gammaproteobacteria bacterium]|nr:hypothetical protein [Gammaproteobacteria bacterium]